jgi:hypothetical protein
VQTVNDYQPDFDIDFQRGLIGEQLHKEFLYGTHEVKTDYRTAETGNFYVETRQRNHHTESLSGLNTTKADFWVQASPLGHGGIYIRTEVLKQLFRQLNPPQTEQPILSELTNASTGRLLRLDDLLWALGMRNREGRGAFEC